MALLYADSFDHLDLTRYTEHGLGPGVAPLAAGTGRRGTAGCEARDVSGGYYGYIYSVTDPTATGLILAFAVRVLNNSPTGSLARLNGAGGPGGTPMMTVSYQGASGWGLSATGGLSVIGGAAIQSGVWYFVEARIRQLGGGGDSIELRVNGQVIGTASGTLTSLPSTLTSVQFGSTTSNADQSFIDDVVLMNLAGSTMNNFLGDVQVHYYNPNADGAVIELTGSDGDQINNYDNINEPTPSSAPTDYNRGGSTGLRDLYALANLSTSATWTVHGAQIGAKVRKSIGQTAWGRLVAVSGGSTALGSTIPLSTTYSNAYLRLSAAPDGTSWGPGDFNDLQIGFEISSS